DELLERRLRSLRHGVERAEGLDLVAEELDASGLLRRGGVDIDDPAAPREGPGLAHLGHRLVPEIEEPRRRFGPRQTVPGAERAAATREILRRDRVLEEGAQARDDGDRGLRCREPPEREEPLMDRGHRRRARLDGHRLALGQYETALFDTHSLDLR